MKWIIGDYGDILETKEFGACNGVIYVDISENVLKKAVELIENGSLKEHGSRARGFVEKYNWEDIVADFEGVLEEVT
jgi:glycosyltransferase involved in cell wall biosynthesis